LLLREKPRGRSSGTTNASIPVRVRNELPSEKCLFIRSIYPSIYPITRCTPVHPLQPPRLFGRVNIVMERCVVFLESISFHFGLSLKLLELKLFLRKRGIHGVFNTPTRASIDKAVEFSLNLAKSDINSTNIVSLTIV